MAGELTRDEVNELMKALDGDSPGNSVDITEYMRRELENAPTAIERTGDAKKHYLRAEELVLSNILERSKSIFQQAVDEYSEVIKLLPHDDESYSKRGDCLREMGQQDKAFDDYTAAIGINPKGGYYYMGRCSIYFVKGEREKANAELEKALQLDPDNAGNHYFRFALCLEYTAKDTEQAAEYYQKSVDHGDFEGYAKSALERLGKR